MTWLTKLSRRRKRGAFYLAVGLMFVSGAALLGVALRGMPSLCEPPLVAYGPYCCGKGQRLEGNTCVGVPMACGAQLYNQGGPNPGCVLQNRRIRLAKASARIGPIDWEAQGKVRPRTLRVAAFSIDRAEVNWQRWQRCEQAGKCRKRETREPGLPVVGVSVAEAQAYCAFEGGRLPSSDEWIYAAAGREARRYPWGNTGLVCRRAVYGLGHGPCANGATGPTLGGSRPSGQTPTGLFDMVGNVKEWVSEADGSFSAMGGSYLSQLAGDLKSWSQQTHAKPGPDIGFRCAYD